MHEGEKRTARQRTCAGSLLQIMGEDYQPPTEKESKNWPTGDKAAAIIKKVGTAAFGTYVMGKNM